MKAAILESSPGVSATIDARRFFFPSLADFLFGAFLVWMFVAGEGWKSLLGDGDTGWHIRTGDYVLSHGRVPQVDIFSYSKPGQPWFAWEWLTDVIFSALHTAWGLKAVAFLAGVVLAATATLLFKQMIWRGANLFISLVLTLLAMGSASIHYLARPHIFTLLLVTVALWILERDRRDPSPAVWSLIPLAAVWTNLHGGWVALIVMIGLLAAVSGLEWFLNGNPVRFRRYTLLGAGCALATLVNPYGYHLHLHVATYLRSSWILEAVEEFQSPKFRNENMLQFELLLFLGIGTVGLLLAKRKYFEALLILFWAQASLTSVRHAPIYAIAATPILAAELTALWDRWSEGKLRTSVAGILRDLSTDLAKLPMHTSVWAGVILISITFTPAKKWPTDFPDIRFPVAVVNKDVSVLAPSEGKVPRILTSDQWGDYLIYRFYPRQKVFVDGRSDFYGQEFGKDYMHLAGGNHRWRGVLDRYQFDFALVPVEWPLVELLKQRPEWKIRQDDGLAVLFERTTPVLMKTGKSDEVLVQQNGGLRPGT